MTLKKYTDPQVKKAVDVLNMLEGLPKDIKDMFTPKTRGELEVLEKNIEKFYIRSLIRNKVMKIQRKYNLPLRPNDSLRRTEILAEIAKKKKKRNEELEGKDYGENREGPGQNGY